MVTMNRRKDRKREENSSI